jgi:metal-responsive CopG/Arc/MetJ family transcriptional regulator
MSNNLDDAKPHCIQLRLPKNLVSEMDLAIDITQGQSRNRFIRLAIRFALDSLIEEGSTGRGEAK